jgi:hypothetical protein
MVVPDLLVTPRVPEAGVPGTPSVPELLPLTPGVPGAELLAPMPGGAGAVLDAGGGTLLPGAPVVGPRPPVFPLAPVPMVLLDPAPTPPEFRLVFMPMPMPARASSSRTICRMRWSNTVFPGSAPIPLVLGVGPTPV